MASQHLTTHLHHPERLHQALQTSQRLTLPAKLAHSASSTSSASQHHTPRQWIIDIHYRLVAVAPQKHQCISYFCGSPFTPVPRINLRSLVCRPLATSGVISSKRAPSLSSGRSPRPRLIHLGRTRVVPGLFWCGSCCFCRRGLSQRALGCGPLWEGKSGIVETDRSGERFRRLGRLMCVLTLEPRRGGQRTRLRGGLFVSFR